MNVPPDPPSPVPSPRGRSPAGPLPDDARTPEGWTPLSWQGFPQAQQVSYPDPAAAERALAKLRSLPPLVTSWEIERLKSELAEAQAGARFVLQGGDCAETLADCRPESITNKLKILLQMSLVLVHGLKKPVVRIGRFAGQYAKPRSSATETRSAPSPFGRGGGEGLRVPGAHVPSEDPHPGPLPKGEGAVTLPSYFGDLINSAEFTPEARTPDPRMMVRAYQHAALTLNFIRALVEGGFADLHHPEYWDLSFFSHASLSPESRAEYQRMTTNLADGLRFMEALGEQRVEELTRVEFFTSHEGLNLLYESAQTRRVPRRSGFYDLTTHLPWIGDRTRGEGGAHVEFFRGIRNPVAVKLGAAATPDQVLRLVERLNPLDEPGKLTLITRTGAASVGRVLPPLLEAVRRSGRRVLWMCDPMHGNTVTTASGIKTRSFDTIVQELQTALDAHAAAGTRLGGVHFELTGEDVTECIGGAAGITEAGLSTNYASLCDPRLNYQQSLELAFLLARRLRGRM